MRRLKCTLLLIFLVSVVQTVKSDQIETKKFQPCSPSNATEQATGCPKGSNCIENGTVNGTTQGFCVCESTFEVNQSFSANDTKSKYCIEKKAETHPTEATVLTTKAVSIPTTTVKQPEPTTTVKSETTSAETATTKKPETEDANEVKVAPAPGSHHIVGGILLPIFIVLAFVCGVFAIRKYDLIERAHGFIRHRQQETRYNGLMENDFDDDPLLI